MGNKALVFVEKLTSFECEKCNGKIACTQEEKREPDAYLITCKACRHIQSYGWQPSSKERI